MPAESMPAPARAARDQDVARTLWIVLGLNLLVSGLKLGFGFLAGSLSLIADGFHSALDGVSNIVGLVGMRVARRAPDAGHPYGHRKFEALAALGISLFLFFTGYEILGAVIGRLRHPQTIHPEPATFLAVLFTVAVNLFVTRYERREGRRLRSMILLADARHTQSDVFASTGVLFSLVAALFHVAFLDLCIAVVIAGFIGYSGYLIVSGAFTVLADSQVIDPDRVVRIATQVEGVTHAHRVRSRGLPDDIHVDLHLHVPPDMSIARAHALGHEASSRIRQEIEGVTDVVIHVEPEDEHEL